MSVQVAYNEFTELLKKVSNLRKRLRTASATLVAKRTFKRIQKDQRRISKVITRRIESFDQLAGGAAAANNN